MIPWKSAKEAIALLPKKANVFVHGAAATPHLLLKEIVAQADRFEELTFVHLHTEGTVPYASDSFAKKFRIVNLFVGSNLRNQLDYDRIDYLPCFLSEIPSLFRNRQFSVDVALLQVSPPDHTGHCSLGVSVDVAKAAADSASLVIAQVNRKMPRVHGDGFLPISHFHAMVECDEPLPETIARPPTKEEAAIALHVAELVEDGSTLQLGIGSIPNAVARQLQSRKNLGLHTEMWSDGALSLIQSGAIDNSKKKVHQGKSISGFLNGSQELYSFVHDNPSVLQLEVDYVNNPTVIARNPKVVAINSAVEVDLSGQVCADSLGHHILSGVGGQMDFMRGAALSKGGKPIIAMQSCTKNGESKIVCALRAGAGVVTTRAHVHYLVTEYGVVNLIGKTLRERARAMIEIAHPDHREKLERDFWHTHFSRAKKE